jgi:sarcosine oxidase subunit beta
MISFSFALCQSLLIIRAGITSGTGGRKNMVEKANIVIIGAGINGCATAYNLAKLGAHDVVVVEKEMFVAAGSTGLSASGIRQQFGTEINIKISMESVRILERFDEEMGHPSEFIQSGYLFLITSGEQKRIFDETVALQKSLGVDVDFITREEIVGKYPFLKSDDILCGTFCPTDGYADPHSITQGYYKRAKELGVKFLFETELKDILTKDNVVTGVTTDKGEIKTDILINAGGPYAQEVGKMAGVEIPALPIRRQVYVTQDFEEVPERIPMIIDSGCGLYFRKEGKGVLFGLARKDEPPGFNLTVDQEWFMYVAERMMERVPSFEKAAILKSWAGLYSVTPDHHAIIGEIPPLSGFYMIGGFSGHGVMHSAASSKLLAEKIMGKESEIDISPLSIKRFEGGGKGIEEPQVL